jgi:formylglycine-generating enzyme required for sulfatase activity
MRYLHFAIGLCATIAFSCSDSDLATNPSPEGTAFPIRIAVGKVAASKIDRAEVVVTGPGITTAIVVELSLLDGEVVGSVIVPVGPDRVFTINAYDAQDVLQYTGSTRADVNQDVQVSLPSIAVVAVGQENLPPARKTLPAYGDTEVTFVLVPGGHFQMGYNDGVNGPEHTVYLDHYYIGEFEITNDQYLAYLRQYGNNYPAYRAGGEDQLAYVLVAYPPDDNPRLPIVEGDDGAHYMQPNVTESRRKNPVLHMNWWAARHYCEEIGARLPTEAEWEKAARGTDSRFFPWGNKLYDGYANISQKAGSTVHNVYDNYSSDVGAFPMGISPYGAHDMVGNAAEWVYDIWDSGYYFKTPLSNPRGPVILDGDPNQKRAFRGGSFRTDYANELTTYNRGIGQHSVHFSEVYQIGFRCASDP